MRARLTLVFGVALLWMTHTCAVLPASDVTSPQLPFEAENEIS